MMHGSLSITATSQAQRRSWGKGVLAAPEEVASGLWAVALPMPGSQMPYSLGYAVLASDGVHIVDPGWHHDATFAVWEAFLADHGRSLRDTATLVITHSHADHLGAAARVREISGARVLMSQTEARVLAREHRQMPADKRFTGWGVPEESRAELFSPASTEEAVDRPEPDALFVDGEEIVLGGRGGLELVARPTPGHTDGHTCFVAERAGVILTGDHVLPQINPGIGLGPAPDSDPLIDGLKSLRAMRAYDHLEVLPGHEYRFRGLAARSEQIAAHHLRRTRAIAELVPMLGDAPVWEYARRSPWSRGWEGTRGFMRVSALTQTELHLAAVRDGRAGPWLSGDWAADR